MTELIEHVKRYSEIRILVAELLESGGRSGAECNIRGESKMEWKTLVMFVAGLGIGGLAGYCYRDDTRLLGIGVAVCGIVGGLLIIFEAV